MDQPSLAARRTTNIALLIALVGWGALKKQEKP